MTVFQGIPGHKDFLTIVPVERGFSTDRKYCITTTEGTHLLLRLSDASLYEKKLAEFEAVRVGFEMGMPMPEAIDFGLCDDNTWNYTLLSWVEGRDMEDVLVELGGQEQYQLGLETGRLLARLHTIPVEPGDITWEQSFDRKLCYRKQALEKTGIELPGLDVYLSFIEEHRHLLHDRPVGFAHGDYHVGNLVVAWDGTIFAIDFNRCKVADPWDDHKRVVFDVEVSQRFAAGRIDGYFNGNVPQEFWTLLGMYCASNAIGSIAWAVPFGKDQIGHDLRQSADLLASYEKMSRLVPTWYERAKDEV